MAGYSGTPLLKKLGYKAGHKVLVRNPPRAYSELLGDGADALTFATSSGQPLDAAHLFVTRKDALVKEIDETKKAIFPNGFLWISWPKQKSGVQTDLNENVIREIALGAGLVDVKVCAVDDTWSGLKLVYRLSDRK